MAICSCVTFDQSHPLNQVTWLSNHVTFDQSHALTCFIYAVETPVKQTPHEVSHSVSVLHMFLVEIMAVKKRMVGQSPLISPNVCAQHSLCPVQTCEVQDVFGQNVSDWLYSIKIAGKRALSNVNVKECRGTLLPPQYKPTWPARLHLCWEKKMSLSARGLSVTLSVRTSTSDLSALLKSMSSFLTVETLSCVSDW